jgi:hypothetical protein
LVAGVGLLALADAVEQCGRSLAVNFQLNCRAVRLCGFTKARRA